jgi:outer membrane protein TolC
VIRSIRLLRPFVVALVLAPAVTAAPVPARAEEGPLSLEDAVKLALANNERAMKAPLRVEAAQGSLERARAAFLPTLGASETGSILSQPVNSTGRILTGTGQVQLTQPLFNLPAFPLYAQARHELESQRWGAVEDKRALSFDTAKAFLAAVSSEHLVGTAQQRFERAKASEQDTAARVQAGLNSTNDVTRAVVDSATAATQLATARGTMERAHANLAFLVGRPVTAPLVPPAQTTVAAQRGQWRMEDVVRVAEARRPDIKASHAHTEALLASADEPLYRLAPTLSANAAMRNTIDPIGNQQAHDETASVTLSWTIFDAGARYGDNRTRKAQAQSQALDEHLLRRSVATDIAIALASLRAARQTYQINEQAVEAARRNVDETDILYRQGLARAIELTTANGSLYDAQVSLENAKVSMEQAYLDLRQALGLDPIGAMPGAHPSGAPAPATPATTPGETK